MWWPLTSAAAVVLSAWEWLADSEQKTLSMHSITLPAQSVLVDPLAYNVLGSEAAFRTDAFTYFFNPTNTTPPFFQIFHPSFLQVLGPNPSVRAIASRPGTVFAHEAPIWVPELDEVFFSSECSGPPEQFDCTDNNFMTRIPMKDIFDAFTASGSNYSAVNITLSEFPRPAPIQMTWGGTGPYYSSLLLINSGRGTLSSSLALMNPRPPYNATILLDNFYGRQFNSLNDGKIHPKSGKIFVTDVTYGYLKHFRPAPILPNQVYQFDPVTGNIRVVSDELVRPNGLAFSGDGNTAYIADTGAAVGFLGINQTYPATIYAFDVDPVSQVFKNRRVFAYIDAGVPDGIQVDTMGNVYSSCGDGVHVWDRDGTLIGKFFLGTVSANMVFAGPGRLLILAGETAYLAQIAAEGVKVSFP
ncbi:D-lactonohydrolase-like protein [Wolfiporia cocos MD-104 SS10]|uniref:D-lactonohydrolase-like protein n=1 Tax=Wolfiporia cocos (strain MD-104) TaxID=742152 RepID=A0A2H3JL59_WOLCO|nr:D-lactonohydrolase-like protein [Wolfiporia cocos MD-104 SS10]